MPTEHFEKYEDAEAFATGRLSAYVARDPLGPG